MIKNATVVTPSKTDQFDILIFDEKIIEIAKSISNQNYNLVDASNLFVLPGGIDVHTHFEIPVMNTVSCDDFSSGTQAALMGGTTTIIDFANQNKGNPIHDALKKWHQMANKNCHCDYSFHLAITDTKQTHFEELRELTQEGITSFKIFTAYPHMQLSADEIKTVMIWSQKLGSLLMVHAEDGFLLETQLAQLKKNKNLNPHFHSIAHPLKAETNSILSLIKQATDYNCPIYIVHLSSQKNLIEHPLVYWETCPQYFLLDESLYHSQSAIDYILSPPIRSLSEQGDFWSAFKNNKFHVLSTDHCSFTKEQKRKNHSSGFWNVPNGISGVEYRFELFFSEAVNQSRLSIEQFTELISTNPAKLFGLYPQKGVLLPGSDADLVLLDPNKEKTFSKKTHFTKSDFCPYEYKTIKGAIHSVYLRGKKVVESNKICDPNQKRGMFIKRQNPSMLF